MKIINIEQNTEEWREFRLGKSGGSGLHDLYPARTITKETAVNYLIGKNVDVNPKLSAAAVVEMLTAEDIGVIKAQGDKKDAFYRLVAERIARPITPNDYEDRLNGQKFSMMVRGHLLEPEAISEFEKQNSVNVIKRSIIWQRDDNQDSIYSPDAEVTDEWTVECKALDSHRMIRAYDEKHYPEEYHEQIVKSFITNEKQDRLSFVMLTDVMPSLPYLQFDIYRHEIEQDIRELRAFEDEILKQAKELADRLSF